jgi:hypothetical protein
VITSTKQISPKVLKSLQGKAGAAGKPGANGTNGAPGATGPGGPQGPAGSNGENGKEGAAGTVVTSKEKATGNLGSGAGKCTEGGSEFTAGSTKTYACNGKNGTPGLNGVIHGAEPLPVGATETGSFATEEFTKEVPEFTKLHLPISFPIQLAAELPVENTVLLKVGETTANCAGSAAAPTAASGFLCVYLAVENEIDIGTSGIRKSGVPNKPGASKAGAILSLTVGEEGVANENDNEQYGTWAVTGCNPELAAGQPGSCTA